MGKGWGLAGGVDMVRLLNRPGIVTQPHLAETHRLMAEKGICHARRR